MQSPARIWRHFDVWLLASVTLLTVAGVALVQSAIAGNIELAETPTRQALYGAIVILVVLFGILATGLVRFGAARWFQVGTILIQPSEIAKVGMVLILASYLARHQHEIHDIKTVLRSLLLASVPALLVFLQPDLDTTIILGMTWVALIWAAGIQFKHLGILVLAGLASPIAAWPFLQQYQQGRIVQFLFPDPAAQYGDVYNVNQALTAIGSGGLFGQGYGAGTQTQLRFLKVRHSDFIFSVLSEEFGFVGAILALVLLGFVIYRCIRAARLARDTFGALICFGVATLLLLQVAFNVGMNLNLIPVSGLTLPFLSYGGSSLLASLIGIGLVESVVLRQKRIEF
jgi:rod shape determining protein RodA